MIIIILCRILFKKHKIELKPLNRKTIIDDYLAVVSSEYNEDKKYEKKLLENFFSLKIMSKDNKNPKNIQYKNDLLNDINRFSNKKFNKINTFFVQENVAFGNLIIDLNNVIYYCEVLECKNIYLNQAYNWTIKDNIVTEKMSISLRNIQEINCNEPDILCLSLRKNLYWLKPSVLKPEVRINIIKNEIKRNLPQVDVNPNDLYIHIRSGNIFTQGHAFYSQPPFCFYQTIIENFKFRYVYMISETINNPVLMKLHKEYDFIIYKMFSVETDLAYLANAYNLVNSVSTFAEGAIKINDNLKNLWEYDIIRNSEKVVYLHHDFYDYPRKYTIYKMIPSDHYKSEMFTWKIKPSQLQLMISEKCNNKFIIIKPNI